MRLYLSDLSLRDTLRARSLSPTELPDFARENGYDGVELSDRLLMRGGPTKRSEFRQALSRSACGFILDIECDLTYGDDTAWRSEIEQVKRALGVAGETGAEIGKIWLGGQLLSFQKLRRKASAGPAAESEPVEKASLWKAALAGKRLADLAHAVRTGLPHISLGSEAKIKRAVRALEMLLPDAERAGVPLAIENHWGISSRPENILRVLREVRSNYLGTCPDFGNFPRGVDRYDALRLLAPSALVVHAKSAYFMANGEERNIDYGRCLRILREAGYDGVFSIEYVGRGDELGGCALTRQLLQRHWSQHA